MKLSQKHDTEAEKSEHSGAFVFPSPQKLGERDCFETMAEQTGISLLHPAAAMPCLLLFMNTKELVSPL